MDTAALFLLVLQLGSLLLAAWLCLPGLLSVLGGLRLQNGFRGGPEEADSYWTHDVDENLYDEVKAAGFKAVGVYWERARFGRTFHEVVFSRPGEPGFALLHPNHELMSRRVCFLTGFTSGAVIFTKNYQGGSETEQDDFIAGAPGRGQRPVPDPEPPDPEAQRLAENPLMAVMRGLYPMLAVALVGITLYAGFGIELPTWVFCAALAVVSYLFKSCQSCEEKMPSESEEDPEFRASFAEVWSEHRRRVARFQEAGHVPIADAGQEGFLEAERLYHEHWYVQRDFVGAERSLLCVKLAYFGIIPLFAGLALGFDHVAPWICLLIEGLVLAFIRYGMTSTDVVKWVERLNQAPSRSQGTSRSGS